MRRDVAVIILISCVAAVCLVLLREPFGALDDQVTGLHYRLRGERHADTNVVIVYIDQEAIRSLDWPVRRNFYALMLKALNDLRVRAVGIEAVFEDRKPEYREYDDLLARMVGATGNVVLTGYFDSVATPGAAIIQDDSLPPGLFDYPAVLEEAPPGKRLHLPFKPLQQMAAGIGHVNVAGSADIDLFIAHRRARVPAFGVELLRVASGTDRNGLAVNGRRVIYRHDVGSRSFTSTEAGRTSLDFPGGITAFTTYPFLDVLRAYDALRGDRAPSLPVASLKGKIVLLGVIAEGRSEFVRTPVDPRLPAVVMHATFIDNALGDRFIGRIPLWLSVLILCVVGVLSGMAVLLMRTPYDRSILVVMPVILFVISFLLFRSLGLMVPVVGPTLSSILSGIAGLLLRQRQATERVDTLESEKKVILERLHDREARVAMLEQQLIDRDQARSKGQRDELLEELRAYKAEIRSLSSQANDMDVYQTDKEESSHQAAEFEGIVYEEGGKLEPVVQFVTKIAASDAPVLILGESGTGKELVARAIHRRSPRAKGMFIAVNCGALSESLLESELFGHERGSFTGAVKDKPGRFELAQGGTIFLDEIGEVSESFQLKLLRVVQEGEFERVGGTTTLKTNVRVVAATNRPLKDLVKQKKFREDLFYRLNVLTVGLPPLRERRSDIPLLVDHFLRRDGSGIRLSKNVMDALQNFSWPGNIRELESALTRGVLLAKADQRSMITVKDLSEEIAAAVRGSVPVEEQVLESLRRKGFSRSSVTETADELGGLNRGTVAEYLRGECLKTFVVSTFDLDRAIQRVSLSTDAEVNLRVRKKFEDYLSNIAEAITPRQPWEVCRLSLKPKAKNLPQKYHVALEQVAEAFYRGVWKVPS